MNLVTVISSDVDTILQRIVKFLRFGKSDIQTSVDAGPVGYDGPPIKGMVAVYSETAEKGKTVLVGYLIKNKKALPGEVRLFAVDDDATEKVYMWLQKDGTILLNGNTDNAVRYAPLNTAMEQLNTFMNEEFAKIASGIATGGGSYTPGTCNIDITDAKIEEVKTS